MTPRERFLAALHRQPTDVPAVGNAVSIATVSLMEATGCFFPAAHVDPQVMAGLAAAGHGVLGYDTIAPVFSRRPSVSMRPTRWAARWTGAGRS
ncbi:MAG: uroporphyrinogen decarboxylase family protein [Armatimonadota bacterium]|nr:uroporphyrinogen decarboxylase family protein [Armatimonadota bacterium]